jgi:hypothetical protein
VLLLAEPRVLICGDRNWKAPGAVTTVCDRLEGRYGDRLNLIEGAASGADQAAHDWCLARGLDAPPRHRGFPVDWDAERIARPGNWRIAGPERNARMLAEDPQLIIAFHGNLNPYRGGTSGMCMLGLLVGAPVWLIPGPNPRVGQWLRLNMFPQKRARDGVRLLQRILPPEMTQKIQLAA